MLGGLLLEVHDQIEEDLLAIDQKLYTSDDIKRMLDISTTCSTSAMPNSKEWMMMLWWNISRQNSTARCVSAAWCATKANPAASVHARNPDGSTSPQILESNQVDPNNEAYMKMMGIGYTFQSR